MDNLIYVWAINRLLGILHNITPLCIGSVMIALMFFLFAIGGVITMDDHESTLKMKLAFKKWLIWSVILSFFTGIFGAFKLDKTEFKTVAVYLIGKEVVQSDRGEKIISIIDTKLDEWIKKVEH